MNKQQKSILIDFIVITTVTTVAVVAMVNFKDWVNRSEAMQSMKQISQIILQYKKDNGLIPPESYVDSIKENLLGRVRLGDLQYRARWIDFESRPDTILAYTQKNYRSLFVHSGFIVLRLDGRVEWMDKKEFEALLAKQQSSMETKLLIK